MTVYVARNRTNAVERINSQMEGTVDLDYETAWEDAFELGRLGQQYGVVVQHRTIEHIAVRSPEVPLPYCRRRNSHRAMRLSVP